MRISSFVLALAAAFGTVLLAGSAHGATIINPAFDGVGRSTGASLDKNYTGNLAVGPVNGSADYFRTYLTFDLSSATTVSDVALNLFGTGGNVGSESNTSSLAQVFTLFGLASDWDGAAAPGPTGSGLATVNFTPAAPDDTQNVSFNSAALTAAYNAAVGGNLYMGIMSDGETSAPGTRSFKWFPSVEDTGGKPQMILSVPPAGTIAQDSFVIDADPNVGYTAGWAFDSGTTQIQGPDTTGMTVADWDNGNTAIWKSDGTGLDYAATGGEVGGSALWDAFGGGARNVSRLLDSPVSVATGEEYWMAAMVQASGTLDTSGLVLGGFADNDNPTSATNPQGYWVGVQGDGSELDLVISHRNSGDDIEVLADGISLDTTQLAIIKSVVNASGNQEDLSVWVNPTDVSSEAALGTAVSGLGPDLSLFGTAFTQLSFYGDSLGMQVRFDEMALGATLADVVTPSVVIPIPEPSTLAIWSLGLLGLFGFTRRRTR